jgi:hypothetical protein
MGEWKGYPMRKLRVFRPAVSEVLEDRLVPSPATLPPPPVVLGHPVPLPAPVQVQVEGNARAGAAFDAFVRSYAEAVSTILLAPGPDGSVDPAANREAFDAAVGQALQALADGLVASLGDAAADPDVPAPVVEAIVGDGADSLRSQLQAVATEAIAQDDATAQALIAEATQAARQAASRVSGLIDGPGRPLVAQAATAPDPAETVILSTETATRPEVSSRALIQVRGAFGAFLTHYFQAVRDVLLAPGANGRPDPTARRADFDARVGASLRALSDTVSGSLRDAGLPESSGLVPRVEEAIAGDGPGSLEERLSGLPTPEGPEAAMVRDFTLGSFQAVVGVFSRVAGDLLRALAPAAGAD